MIRNYIFMLLTIVNAIRYPNIMLNRSNLVMIREPINTITSNKIIENLVKIRENDIYIFLNTPGGSVTNGLEIINTINSLQNINKNIHCIGNYVASMGFTIMQTCNYRYALPNAIFMQHQMSLLNRGNLNNVNNILELYNIINKRLTIYQAYRLNITHEQFIKLITNDYWIYGEDIKINNIVDDIVTITCNYKPTNEIEQVELLNNKIDVIYSSCPLVTKPLKINLDSNSSLYNELKHEIIDYFYFSNIDIN